jgi:cobalt-precorrin-7 (C5)-methyltransferase
MKIVGVGCGPGMLTEKAIEAIASAKEIWGSERAIEMVSSYIPSSAEVHGIRDYKALKNLPADAVVLSTGDPMLAGLGYLGGEVIPGISSLQYASAKLGFRLTRTVVVDSHGKDHSGAMERVAEEVYRGYIVFVLPDPDFETDKLAEILHRRYGRIKIALCERLGYPEERISEGDSECPPKAETGLFVLVVGDY